MRPRSIVVALELFELYYWLELYKLYYLHKVRKVEMLIIACINTSILKVNVPC